MPTEIQLLRDAISVNHNPQQEMNWKKLLHAMRSIISKPLNWQTEWLLLKTLRFDGRLILSEDSAVPHSLSPEDMLKSLAAQALGRWTGLTHLSDIQFIEVTTASPVLASILRGVIRQAQNGVMPKSDLEEIGEVHSDSDPEISYEGWQNTWDAGPPQTSLRAGGIVTHTIGVFGGLTFIPEHQHGKKQLQREPGFVG